MLSAACATAQERPLGNENGIKFGAGRLHPFLDLELRFDSAAGFFPRDPTAGPTTVIANAPLEPEIIGHLRPGLRFDVPGANTDVGLSGFADYVWYTGLLTQGSNNASRLDGQADFSARFNREGLVGFEMGDHFSRSDRTDNAAVGVGVISLMNEVRASVPLRPGGGALELAPGMKWGLETFRSQSTVTLAGCENNVSCVPEQMDYQNYHFDLDGKWKFLPKTALVLDTGFDLRQPENTATNPAARLIQASAGLAGLISPRLALLAKVGWGQDLGSSGASTLVGHGELTYLWSESRNLKIGYLRQLSPVPAFGTFSNDRVYAEGRALFGGRLTLRAFAAYDYMAFSSGSNRFDSSVRFELSPEYQVTRWLILAGGYALTTRGSNLSADSINFARHELFTRVTVTY